jgi:hypothetical protein
MVTLVVNMLRVNPGATLTAIGWTFGVFDCGTLMLALVLSPGLGDVAVGGALAAPGLLAAPACDELAGGLSPPPPPPQPARVAKTRKRA